MRALRSLGLLVSLGLFSACGSNAEDTPLDVDFDASTGDDGGPDADSDADSDSDGDSDGDSDADSDADSDSDADTDTDTDTGLGDCPDPEPEPHSVENGGACATADDCAGIPEVDEDGDGVAEYLAEPGYCYTQESDGYPGGTCYSLSWGGPDFDHCEDDDVCWYFIDLGGDGVCACLQSCATSDDCRRGYSCFDPGGVDEPFCYPDCVTDEDCNCGEPAHCNEFTGSCEADRDLGRDGDPCVAGEDCESGICATEAEGFPGGACYSLCSLSKNNCPVDGDDDVASPCEDIANSTADLGICDDGCESDDDCRADEGYVCTPVGGGSVCLPEGL